MKKREICKTQRTSRFFICAEGVLSRRFRNEGDYIRLHPPYENNIPRCSAAMLLLRSSVVSRAFYTVPGLRFFIKIVTILLIFDILVKSILF